MGSQHDQLEERMVADLEVGAASLDAGAFTQ